MTRAARELLAVDLDGTLLDRSGRPHDRDLRALRAAVAAGVRVSLITGRLYSGTRPTSELVGLHGAVGCADGSHLVQARSHATLLHLGIREAQAVAIRDVLRRSGAATFVFAEDAIGHDPAGAPFVGYVSTWSTDVRVAPDVFEHQLWDCPRGITAVIALGTRDRIALGARDLSRDLSPSVFIVTFPVHRGPHSGLWAMLLRASGGTKGTALRWIAEHEGVALANTVCVGDWLNDVPMFEVAGRSFAMGQAPDEVKSRATDVLPETVETGGGVERAVFEAFQIRA